MLEFLDDQVRAAGGLYFTQQEVTLQPVTGFSLKLNNGQKEDLCAICLTLQDTLDEDNDRLDGLRFKSIS